MYTASTKKDEAYVSVEEERVRVCIDLRNSFENVVGLWD